MSLSKDSTLNEMFAFVRNPDQDVQVLPVTLSAPGADFAQMMIVIQGKANTANVIMANLMTSVQEMYELAEQKAAEQAIVAPDGEPLSDEPVIILS